MKMQLLHKSALSIIQPRLEKGTGQHFKDVKSSAIVLLMFFFCSNIKIGGES
jgi:hypothetical protein